MVQRLNEWKSLSRLSRFHREAHKYEDEYISIRIASLEAVVLSDSDPDLYIQKKKYTTTVIIYMKVLSYRGFHDIHVTVYAHCCRLSFDFPLQHEH